MTETMCVSDCALTTIAVHTMLPCCCPLIVRHRFRLSDDMGSMEGKQGVAASLCSSVTSPSTDCIVPCDAILPAYCH